MPQLTKVVGTLETPNEKRNTGRSGVLGQRGKRTFPQSVPGKAAAGKLDATNRKGQLLVGEHLVPSVGAQGMPNCIAIHVNKVPAVALVDTRASVSLLTSGFADRAGVLVQNEYVPTLRNARGGAIQTLGVAAVRLVLGEWQGRHECVVADVAHDLLLGIDFLRGHGADLLFGQGILKLGGAGNSPAATRGESGWKKML